MKKKQILKRLSALSLAIAMVMTGIIGTFVNQETITAKAAENEITTQNGIADFQEGTTSITVSAWNNDLIGKKFKVHQLFEASVSESGESINYSLAPKYDTIIKDVVSDASGIDRSTLTEYQVIDYIQTLNNFPSENAYYGQNEEGRYSEYRYFVEALKDAINNAGILGKVVNATDTTDNGEIILSNLAAGYYIIDEITDVQGTHSAAALCMANTSTDSYINLKSDYPSIIKKLKEDDGAIGWNDIGDFEIGQDVHYRFESFVPDINGYHSYYYAWHDVMDEALTFNPHSVQITISKELPRSTSNVKSYTLKTGEFSVNIAPTNGATFIVEIKDLKAIVDREFPDFNSLNENRYNHTVSLEYKATLNDKAAEDTGRPGFENDVRLEFSNDPDSDGTEKTGFTPWDTTVCFTYHLDVKKVNDSNEVLGGAKFRLYSDENCRYEVYVKQTENGYNVINRDFVGGTDHSGGSLPITGNIEMVSNADGSLKIYGLDSGTYYLKETEAPTGYRKILDPIKLTVNATFTDERQDYVKGTGVGTDILKSLTATADTKIFVAGSYVEEHLSLATDVETGTMNLTVVNTRGTKLPATGSVMTLVCVGVGSALVGYSIYRKRKEDKCES